MMLKDIVQAKGVEVHAIAPSALCDDAVATLVRYNIGSLLVRNNWEGAILGIITERDILRAQAMRRVSLRQMSVASVMSADPIIAEADDDIVFAMRLMTNHRIRHLPVMVKGELLGIVSIGDIVKAQHDHLEMENHFMRSYINGEGPTAARL